MMGLSPEQQAIVDAPLVPLAVVACAGSGKTFTAVHRLLEIRRRLGESRGRVALLSFSNVAVRTFRDAYRPLAESLPTGASRQRVEIDTLDGFLTSNILRPHAARTMGCLRTPFLVNGSEPFLENRELKLWAEPASGAPFPVPRAEIGDVVANFRDAVAQFHYRKYTVLIPIPNGAVAVARLGRIGAYTHNLGQYWALRTLQDQPLIRKAMARRYPHIIVDESQDIGTIHQVILLELAAAGSRVSLIGDPSQGIYEFAGADGTFLKGYGQRVGVHSYPLTRNYRSVPAVVTLANALANRADTADRPAPHLSHGAFFIGYKSIDRNRLIVAFQAAIAASGLRTERAAIVCRGSAMVESFAGPEAAMGQGLIKQFVRAAVLRDKQHDFLASFKVVAGCVADLLQKPGDDWLASLVQPVRQAEMKPIRREIWTFIRNSDEGLPASSLVADTEWHPRLVARVRTLLDRLQEQYGYVPCDNVGNRLKKTNLLNRPLLLAADLATDNQSVLRVDTVHKVKGESLDALLYLAEKDHVEALLQGVGTELGRIGYVAATRARNLFWIAIPAAALPALRPGLLAKGFVEAGGAAGDTTEAAQDLTSEELL